MRREEASGKIIPRATTLGFYGMGPLAMFFTYHISRGKLFDNNGNYCPENCRFVTSEINNLNRRNNIFIDVNGESVLAREYFSNSNHDDSVDYNIFISRLKLGWGIERSLWTRKRSKNKSV